MVRGLIFDVDGTLVSLKVDVEKLRSTTARELVKVGFDLSFIGRGRTSTPRRSSTGRGNRSRAGASG